MPDNLENETPPAALHEREGQQSADPHDKLASPPSNAPPTAAGASPNGPAAIVVLQAVLDSGAEPYCDLAGIPRLRRKTDKAEFLPWPIRSRQVEAWIAKLYYEKDKLFVNRSVLQQVSLVLEGIADAAGIYLRNQGTATKQARQVRRGNPSDN